MGKIIKRAMTITDVTRELNRIKRKHGDLPVWITHEWSEPLEQTEHDGVHFKDAHKNIFLEEFPARVDIS
jgi:hypothetical protein